jgi:tryptophanyl-tRNA synthetase
VRYDLEEKAGVSNLMTVYAVSTGKDIPSVESEFSGQGYGTFKTAVGEAVDALLSPIRTKALELMQDSAQLDEMMAKAAAGAVNMAAPVLSKVHDVIGLLPLKKRDNSA